MKTELNTGVVVAIAVVVLIVVCFLGSRFFISSQPAAPSADTKAEYMKRMQGGNPMSSGGPTPRMGPGAGGMAGSGGGMPGSGGMMPGSGGR